ncbi:hypothetical protein [Parendozoicomonas sp. Alg238-R29]|uniref:hypothetical protein n=1 Tax=Parendozoicomonas sp. Alg238-R29 TaxID=2993446 RepID=UPI00248D7DC4|nr:hypothetical protein [Parendozoicomonas sp. Alg238-R29]
MTLRYFFRTTVVFILLFCSHVLAVDFHEIPAWDPEVKYKRGTVIAHGTDLYINILPKAGIFPDHSKIVWRKIRYNRHYPLKPYKLYLPGFVVAHDEKYYISRKINLPQNARSLSNEQRWLPFTHPAMGFDLPYYTEDSEEVKTLVGTDINGNGIRDDYETSIIMSSLPAPVKNTALRAGAIYGELIATGTGATVSSVNEAQNILQNMVQAKRCQRQLMKQSGVSWSDATYFDTLDRVEAKYKLQSMLAGLIDQSTFSVPSGDPCEQLTAQ